MKIQCPVVVKMIMTDQLRSRLFGEYNETVSQVQLEIEQLQFQSKKLLQDSLKKGPEAYEIVEQRLNKEEKGRRDKMKHAQALQKQLEYLPNGQEIIHSQLESEVEINVGDNWDEIMSQREIVLKDGVIVEIRQ